MLGCNEYHIFYTFARNAEVAYIERLGEDLAIDAEDVDSSEPAGSDIRDRKLSFGKIGTGPADIVVASEYVHLRGGYRYEDNKVG